MKRMFALLTVCCFFGMAQGYACAQDGGSALDAAVTATGAASKAPPVVNPDDLGGIVNGLIQAVKGGHWAWLVGLIFMVLTWVFNRILKNRIPKKALPWIAIGLGVGTNVAMSFASGLVWYQALSNGFSLGLAAAGGWSAIGKYILPKDKKAE